MIFNGAQKVVISGKFIIRKLDYKSNASWRVFEVYVLCK
jgi:hypothetical protein